MSENIFTRTQGLDIVLPKKESGSLFLNIKNHEDTTICLDPTTLLCRESNNDVYLRLDLHKSEALNKHISAIRLNFVSKKNDKDNDNEPIVSKELIDNALRESKYKLLCGYNLIFDKYFINNELLASGLILPVKHIRDGVSVNIVDIAKLMPLLDNLELQIKLTTVEYEKEFDESIPTSMIEQLIITRDNTDNVFKYNVLRMVFGMVTKVIGDGDFPKDKFNEICGKLNLAYNLS